MVYTFSWLLILRFNARKQTPHGRQRPLTATFTFEADLQGWELWRRTWPADYRLCRRQTASTDTSVTSVLLSQMSGIKEILGETVLGKNGPVDVDSFAEEGYVVGECFKGRHCGVLPVSLSVWSLTDSECVSTLCVNAVCVWTLCHCVTRNDRQRVFKFRCGCWTSFALLLLLLSLLPYVSPIRYT